MTSILSAPTTLWGLYVEYLWNYEPGSWVDRAASTFRILAFLLMAPFAVLTLLDVTSYVIARTLGVIDDTKASTSETGSVTTEADTPVIVIQPESPPPAQIPLTTPPPTYFPGPMEEDGNLELSGVGMFSPAPSQPPSPTISRRELSSHMHNISEERLVEGENVINPERPTSRASSSGESSFAMLDQESSADDAPVTLRRRAQNVTNSSREDS